jgi:hypothetical protein
MMTLKNRTEWREAITYWEGKATPQLCAARQGAQDILPPQALQQYFPESYFSTCKESKF